MISAPPDSPPLEVYLLGLVDFEEVQQLQRRLVYDLGDRGGASLVLCEHPPTISVGRSGSRLHINADDAELREHGNQGPLGQSRGGLRPPPARPACRVLRAPAGAAPARRCSVTSIGLHAAIVGVLGEFDLRGTCRPGTGGVFLGEARVASVGVAVNRWIAYHGLTVNVGPFLNSFGLIAEPGPGSGPYPCFGGSLLRQTSMESRRQRPAPMSRVRETLIRQLETVFGLQRHHVYTDHPLIRRKVSAHVYAQSPG